MCAFHLGFLSDKTLNYIKKKPAYKESVTPTANQSMYLSPILGLMAQASQTLQYTFFRLVPPC